MYCSKCGIQLPEDSKKCPKCNSIMDDVLSSDPKVEVEAALMEGLCNRVMGKFNVQNGHGLLTNKRFIYAKHSLGKIVVMGAAVNLTKGKYEFDIPIQDIENIEDGRQGISKTIVIKTKNGEHYNFFFRNRNEWLKKFNELL